MSETWSHSYSGDKNHFALDFVMYRITFYQQYFLQNAENMQIVFKEYSKRPIEILTFRSDQIFWNQYTFQMT